MQVTLQEMRSLPGICIIMTCMQYCDIGHHWARGIVTPLIEAAMSCHLFLSLLEICTSMTRLVRSYAAFRTWMSCTRRDQCWMSWKLRSETLRGWRVHHAGVLGFNGQAPFKFFTPHKLAPSGLKVNMACDADTVYVLNFMMTLIWFSYPLLVTMLSRSTNTKWL